MSQGSPLTWMHRDAAITDLYEKPNSRHVCLIFNHVKKTAYFMLPIILVFNKNTAKKPQQEKQQLTELLCSGLWERLRQTESLNLAITYLKGSKWLSYLLCCGKHLALSDFSLGLFWPQQWKTKGCISHLLEQGLHRNHRSRMDRIGKDGC